MLFPMVGLLPLEWPLVLHGVHVTHLYRSTQDEQFGCSHILATENSAAMYVGALVCL